MAWPMPPSTSTTLLSSQPTARRGLLSLDRPYVRIGFALLAFCGASAATEPAIPMLFECRNGVALTIVIAQGTARIKLPERTIVMAKSPSHLGRRYQSAEGTLIIDEDFASLVLRSDLRFSACRAAAPTHA